MNDYSSAKSATMATGGGYAGTALAPAPPRLTQINDRLEKTLSHAAEIEKRMDNLATRLLGSTPESVSNDKEPPSPSATVSIMERQIDWLGSVLARANQHLGRLENL